MNELNEKPTLPIHGVTGSTGINVLSLFDGMSCGQIALERTGIKVNNYFASEIDKYAIQVTQKNYPNTKQLGSIVELKGNDLPKIDLLFGGSPCQSFSRAGDGTGFDGSSKLFWEFVRVLNEVKPTYFLLENVIMKKEWEDVITEALGVEPIEICSDKFVPQKRRRLYWTNIPNVKQPKQKYYDVNDFWLEFEYGNFDENGNRLNKYGEFKHKLHCEGVI